MPSPDEYRSDPYDKTARDTVLMLADWVAKENPELALSLKELCQSAEHKCRADLWQERLVLNHLARLSGATSGSTLSYEQLASGLVKSIVPEYNTVTLTGKAAAVDSDLSAAWHPDISGRQIEATDLGDDCSSTLQLLHRAFDLLSNHDLSRALIDYHCRAVSIVHALPELQSGQCISLCSKSVPGLIFFSKAPIILTTESIVHETAHQMLYAIDETDGLVLDTDTRLLTPLRTDPRPISGLLHQTWVLWHLIRLYRTIIDVDHPSVIANRDKVRKRLDRHNQDYIAGLNVIFTHKHMLTQHGIRLVEKWFYDPAD
jgi:hypothetical protein